MLSSDAIKEIFDHGKAAGAPVQLPGDAIGVIVPAGHKLEKVDPVEAPLLRIRQRTTFYDVESFCGYVNRFKSDNTQGFALPGFLASDGKAVFRAALDYHAPGTADRLAHQAAYLPRYSEQWSRWTAAPKMGQAEFAEFIEENRKDIRKPDAATLLDLIRTFKTTRKQDYDSVVYQPNGDVKVAFSDVTEATGGVTVPAEIELGIPVYFKGTVYAVPVSMRYRMEGGKLTFTIKPDRADYIEQAAFDEIIKTVAEKTGLETYLGSWS